MRLLLVLAAAVLVAVLGVVAFVVANLQTLVDAHRDEIVARASRAVGRPLQVGGVAPSFWPLGIRLEDLAIGDDPRFDAAPFVRARALVVAVRPLALFRGRLEASAVRLERPVVTLRQRPSGRWNVASLGDAADQTREAAGGRRPRRARFQLPVEWVLGTALTEIRDGTLELVTETASGSRRLVVRHVRLDADDVRLGADAVVRAAAALDPASTGPDAWLELHLPRLGEQDVLQAPLRAELSVDDVDLGDVARFLGAERAWTGRLARLDGALDGTLTRFTATLRARTAGAVAVAGVALVPAAGGALDVRVRREGARLAADDGTGTLGAFAFTLTGSADLDRRVGELTLASIPGRAFTLEPLALPGRDLRARVVVAPPRVDVPEGHVRIGDAEVAWSGGLRDVDALVGDARFNARAFGGSVQGTLTLAGRGEPIVVQAEAAELEAAAVVAALAPALDDRLTGRIHGRLALALPVAVGPVSGSGSATVTAARLRGVNLGARVLDGLDDVPFLPRLVSARTRARYAELFAPEDTVVEEAHVAFTLAGDRLTSDDVRFDAGCYEIRGGGWIDADGRLGFRGDLVLGSSLSATLRKDLRIARYLCAADGRVTLPFRLRGPLDAPRPEPDLKRLRARGLRVLQEGAAVPGERDGRPDAGAPGRGPQGDAAAVVERLLDEMVRP